jgi:hypothetical protein
MRPEASPVSWLVRSNLPEDLRKAEDTARNESSLDREVVVEAYSAPGGTLKRRMVSSRLLRDYFSSVRLFSACPENAFTVVFYPASNADRYWKAEMARILRTIRRSAAGITIEPLQEP